MNHPSKHVHSIPLQALSPLDNLGNMRKSCGYLIVSSKGEKPNAQIRDWAMNQSTLIMNSTVVNEGKAFMADVLISGGLIQKLEP